MSSQLEKEKGSPVVVEDWEKLAKEVLPKGAYDYVSSGSGGEETLAKNVEEFKKWDLVPRVLVNVEKRDLSIELLNRKLAAPILLAPVGFQTVVHPDGELASARAAACKSLPFITSTVSSYSLEEISAVMGNTPRYFQLYWPNDADVAASFVKRAESAGYDAIVVTVDTPLLGWREKDMQNKYFPMMTGAGISNFVSDPVFQEKYNVTGTLNQDALIGEIRKILFKQDLTWGKIAWLRKQTSLPILLKGIMHKDDALQAIGHEVDGIVVSNHGGRQLDGVKSSLRALESIADVVKGRIAVLFDGGIRRGPDVVKALALGADAVLLGRPYVYGLAQGEEGVTSVLTNLVNDLDNCLANVGKSTITSINKSIIEKYN